MASEANTYGVVFRSLNRSSGRGRRVMICSRNWHLNHGEAFEKSQDGKKRGLRKSFQPGEEPIKGAVSPAPRPTSIPKKIGIHLSNLNTSTATPRASLRRFSFFLAHELNATGFLERYPKSEVIPQDLQPTFFHHLEIGHDRDNIAKAIQWAVKNCHVMASDNLSRSSEALYIWGVKHYLKNHKTGTWKKRCREFWRDVLEVGPKIAESLGEPYQPTDTLRERARFYGLKLNPQPLTQ